jgi:hypothetical protein
MSGKYRASFGQRGFYGSWGGLLLQECAQALCGPCMKFAAWGEPFLGVAKCMVWCCVIFQVN